MAEWVNRVRGGGERGGEGGRRNWFIAILKWNGRVEWKGNADAMHSSFNFRRPRRRPLPPSPSALPLRPTPLNISLLLWNFVAVVVFLISGLFSGFLCFALVGALVHIGEGSNMRQFHQAIPDLRRCLSLWIPSPDFHQPITYKYLNEQLYSFSSYSFSSLLLISFRFVLLGFAWLCLALLGFALLCFAFALLWIPPAQMFHQSRR